MSAFDCDLLIVGLGPVGDSLAALARLHGLTVIAIERSRSIFPLPRTAGFDHEIMRIFQMIGVADQLAPICRTMKNYEFLTASGETMINIAIPQAGPYGWAGSYTLHQPAVEAALRARMAELGVDTRLGTALLSFDQDAQGVTARIEGPDGGGSIRSRYLAGCDGSASVVRETLGIALDDYAFDEPWLVLDAIIEDHGDLPLVSQQICDPARPVTHIWIGGARFRWEFMIKPGETPEDVLDDATIRELLAPWNCSDRAVIERKAVYRFHGLVAQQWRERRVLIAGDAAHQMPPFAGQGMCSGIRDAANIAWKLAAVIRGDADEAMLDSYQTEREPHVRAIIEQAIGMGRVVCILDPVAAAGRDADMLARKRSGAEDVLEPYPDLKGGLLTETPRAGALFPQPVAADGSRFDTLLGIQAVLLGHGVRRLGRNGVQCLDLDDPRLAPFATPIAAWLEAVGTPAVLIRPDRHVFGTGEADRLVEAWHEALQTLPQRIEEEITHG